MVYYVGYNGNTKLQGWASMPPKIRQLKSDLRKAGFVERPAKGSHTFWYDPSDPRNYLTLSGKDGDDADVWKVKKVNAILAKKERKNNG
jgi:predicted RNA binding protein YcfA (HicA-like mRNA interferase family)